MSRPFVARALLLAALLPLAACGPKFIGQTNIEDTADNREILDVMQKYKVAYEKKDAAGIAALASERYLDARDSISYSTLKDDLGKTFDKIRELQLELTVRRIRLDGDRGEVDYFYSTSYQLAGTDAAAWQTESDDKRLVVVRESGAWKVLSGF